MQKTTNKATHKFCLQIYMFRRNRSLMLPANQFFEERADLSTLSRAAYMVNFSKTTCICFGFQNCHLFCPHTMAICKDQVFDLEYFTLLFYTIDNYCNIYFKDFVLDSI